MRYGRKADHDIGAKKYLRQYETLTQRIDILEHEKQELRAMMLSLSMPSRERVQHSRNNDYIGTLYERIDQRERLIAHWLELLFEIRTKIFDEIFAIQNEKYSLVLYKRYVQLCSWDEIAEDMFICKRQVFRLHEQALDAFQEKYHDMPELLQEYIDQTKVSEKNVL